MIVNTDKDLYLLRHGQTLFNSKKLISGWSDSPLTDLGIEQAKRAGDFLRSRHIKFDHAFCSDLMRARTTLETIAPFFPYETKKELREWYFGFYEAELVAIMPRPPFNDYFCQFNGESQDSVRSRMVSCLTDLMESPENHCIIAVSHGRSCKEFLDASMGDDADPTAKVPGNCGMMHFRYRAGEFKLIECFDQNDYATELGLNNID